MNILFPDALQHLYKKWKAAVLPQFIKVKFCISQSTRMQYKSSYYGVKTPFLCFSFSILIPFALFGIKDGDHIDGGPLTWKYYLHC